MKEVNISMVGNKINRRPIKGVVTSRWGVGQGLVTISEVLNDVASSRGLVDGHTFFTKNTKARMTREVSSIPTDIKKDILLKIGLVDGFTRVFLKSF